MMIEILKVIALPVMIIYILVTTWTEYDDTDDVENEERSGMALHTDNLTGCQYLSTFLGSLTPRVDGQGNHLGAGNMWPYFAKMSIIFRAKKYEIGQTDKENTQTSCRKVLR